MIKTLKFDDLPAYHPVWLHSQQGDRYGSPPPKMGMVVHVVPVHVPAPLYTGAWTAPHITYAEQLRRRAHHVPCGVCVLPSVRKENK